MNGFPSPGTNWELVRVDDDWESVALQVTAPGDCRRYYVDIDRDSGNVLLNERLASGAKWNIVFRSNGTIQLQVTADCRFEDYYLDFDSSNGRLILNERETADGTRWRLTFEN